MNFLHFAVFLFVLSSLVLIGVSSIYKSDYQVDSNLIFQRTAGLVTLEKLNLSLSALLVGLIIMLWYVFS